MNRQIRMQMRLYRHILLILAAAAASVQVLPAQNLDPTVEVNRAYEGKLMEVHKPVLNMEVPDSVMRFDLDFDYSVFESPYKGSYEFDPYLLSMKPGASADASRRFYLRAGAGYQLHPQLDLVWSPKIGRGFKMDIHATHRSYIGSYWNMETAEQDGGYLIRRASKDASDRSWKGYDVMTKAGFDAKHDWKKGAFTFGADYYGLARKKAWPGTAESTSSYNAVDAYLGLSNKGEWAQSFLYDLRLDYRYGGEKEPEPGHTGYLRENLFDFSGSVGPVFKENHKVLFDFGLELASYAMSYDATGSQVYLVPHYVFERGPFMLDFGVRLSMLVHDSDSTSFYSKTGQVVYPSMKFHIALIPDAMRLYVNVGGGNRLNTFSSLISSNHHIDLGSASGYGPLFDYTVERMSAAGGFEGRISSRFSYNLRAGYVNYANDLMDIVSVPYIGHPSAQVGYASYQKWYTGLDWCLDVQGFRFDGSVIYTDAWGGSLEEAGFLRPAALKGDVLAEYNWKRRVFVGADCEFASSRRGKAYVFTPSSAPSYLDDMTLPGYADLGVYAEYVTARNLSFWLRGGNLLNMTIQRNPLYAEKGPYFTAGICLNL